MTAALSHVLGNYPLLVYFKYNLVFLMHFTSINLNMPHQINMKIFPQKIYFLK